MVKKFRRSAAGNDEQLPSDLRPPPVLKRTCDYLFNDVIGNATSLARVHHFVWDRTRAIRNDFSIQQLTKPEDLKIAIECYERIARFHIMSLHLLALPEKPYDKYDSQQEREQLDRTLLSLMQYYDDTRGRFKLVNEAEFRAYCVIFQLQDPIPDLEDRVQSWPRSLAQDPRVQKALEIYEAACNTTDMQGPLKPPSVHLIARQDWERFWQLIASKGVSYLMACDAEIYFTLIRRMALRAISKASAKRSAISNAAPEWTMDDLWTLFNFDDEKDLIVFCERFGLSFRERGEDSKLCLDLNSVAGRALPEPSGGAMTMSKSLLVEGKRQGRTLPAVINGLNVRQAQQNGMILEEEEENEEILSDVNEDIDTQDHNDDDSLFVPETDKPTGNFRQPSISGSQTATPTPPSSSFGKPSGFGFGKPSTFGQPSQTTGLFNLGLDASTNTAPQIENKAQTHTPFNFLAGAQTSSSTTPKFASSPFSAGFGPDAASTVTDNPGSALPPASENIASTKSRDALTSASTNSFSTNPFKTVTTTPSFTTEPSIFAPKEESVSSGPAASAFQFPSTSSKPPANGSTTTITPAGNFTMPDQKAPESTSSPTFTTQPEITLSATQTGNNSGSPPSFFTPSETIAKTHPPQPHSPASPAPQPANVTQNSSSTGNNGQALRSKHTNDWKPRTPSKLSTSYTVGDDSVSANKVKQTHNAASENREQGLSQANQVDQFKSTPATAISSVPSAPAASTVDPEAVITRLANELTFDSISGYLKQYVEYRVGKMITQVQEEIYQERLNQQADDYCLFNLSYKYGKRWRETCRHRRLVRQAKERRRRAQRRLQEVEAGGAADDASSVDNASILGSSRAVSTRGKSPSRQELVDLKFQSTTSQSRFSRGEWLKAGSKRSADTHLNVSSNGAVDVTHKRQKSEDHISRRKLMNESHTSNDPNEDILKRSSFLAFSLPKESRGRSSTIKSSYFHLKAMGLKEYNDWGLTRGTKRPRSESLDAQSTSLIHKTNSPRLIESGSERQQGSKLRPSSSGRPVSSKVDEDEALFARLKAARESLQDATDLIKAEKLRRSTGSQESYESPSMIQARQQAREREIEERNVPAYRLRESRFVPREHYPRAIERANEMRVSRSRETSRPVSRTSQRATEGWSNDSGLQMAKASQTIPESPTFPKTTFGSNDAFTTNEYGSLWNNNASSFNGAHRFGGQVTPSFGTFSTTVTPSKSSIPINGTVEPTFLASGAGFGSPSVYEPVTNPFLNPLPNVQARDNPFAGQPMSHFGATTATSFGQRDNTVSQSEIPSALSKTFEAPTATNQGTFGSSRAPNTSSFAALAGKIAEDLYQDESDIERDEEEIYDGSSEESTDQGNDIVENGFGHEDEEDIGSGYASEEVEDNGEYDEEEEGDTEDDAEEEYEEEEYGHFNPLGGPVQYQQQPPPQNASFDSAGHTVDDAIELSD